MAAVRYSGVTGMARVRIPLALFCFAFAVLFVGSVSSTAATPRGQAGVRAGVPGQNRQLCDDAVLQADRANGVGPTATTGMEETKAGREGPLADGGRTVHIFNEVIGAVLAAVMILCLVYLVRRKR